MGGELFFKHCFHFTLLSCWWKVAAREAAGEIIDLAEQLWRPARGVLALAGQSALDEVVLDVG